ncbi:RHS repeat-associated core domain-containing protein [Corallococcus exiguus]|uniref:RHS repeat-associated core domain-containing protein n=1 Tax=Corallococcus exiguus TaxID=83462 RepID=UPI001560F794|nr:RHS repeat-associated core domain-containing protein [Corallococcus exiguus]NRD50335.1 RHS repeat protein [Corallococcus exiguus]
MSQSGRVAVGHPVDVASGALFNTWTDLALPGSVPLLVERYYSTALLGGDPSAELLGPGWRLSFQMSLRETLDGFIYTNGQGVELPLEDRAGDFARTGRLVAPAVGLDLRRRPDGDVVLIRYSNEPHPLKLVFRRRDGSLHYELGSILHTEKNRVDLLYDAKGRPARLVQTRTGHSLKLQYTGSGRLSAVLLDKGLGNPEPRLRYEYNARHQLWRVSDTVGVLAVFEYDAQDRIVSEVKHTGAVFSFAFDAAGRCIHATGADHREERWLEYQPARRVTHVRDSHGHVTTYEYNAAGQVTLIRSPLGAVSAYEFDDAGRLVAETDANKVRAEREYDALGRFCAVHFPGGGEVRLRHDDDHQQVALVDPLGEEWRYSYDSQGLPTEVLEPTGLKWRVEYDVYGERSAVINPQGGSFTFERDARGFNTRRVDCEGCAWRTEYDEDGRVAAEVDPLGQRTRYVRDAAGRVVRVELPDGRSWSFDLDPVGRITRYQAPDGTSTRLHISNCGNLTELVDARGGVTAYQWDSEPGRLLEIRNPLGETYRREYDADGRPVSQTFWDGRVYRYEWDAVGNCIAIIDPAGRRTEYGFDAWGQVVRRDAPDGTETRYEYDANRLLTKVDSGVMVEFERDLYGRILSEVQDGVRLTFEYDALGRRTEVRTSWGDVTRYAWNRNGVCTAIQRASGTVEFVRDVLGREVRRVLPGGGVVETQYDALSRPLEQVYQPPGWVTRGLAAPTSSGDGDHREPVQRRYTYDAFGHISEVSDSLRGRTWYEHDKTGNLTRVLRAQGVSEAFEYDAMGNRTAQAVVGGAEPGSERSALPVRRRTTLAYEPGGRLASAQSDQDAMSYVYDADGHLILKRERSRTGEQSVWRYEWTALGQLKKVVRPDGTEWTYVYDGLGRRVAKRGPPGEWRYLWDGSVVLQERDASESLSTWLYEPSSHRVLLKEDGGLHFVLPDGVGAASEVVAPDGSIEWVNAQGTWGEQGSGAEEFPIRFPGQWYDAESGWHYNHFRYYDPQSGRYVSPDPIGLMGGYNLYAYVPSPVEWMDPLGLSARHPAGGPFAYDGNRDYSGVGRSSHPTTGDRDNFTVPGGKCLATMSVDGGNTSAFVSGIPDNATMGSQPRSLHGDEPFSGPASVTMVVRDATSGGPNGNWTHAEMHAMNHILQNPGAYAGRNVTLHIDRPPCREGAAGRGSCSSALAGLVRQAREAGVNLTVTYNDEKGRRQTYHVDDCG